MNNIQRIFSMAVCLFLSLFIVVTSAIALEEENIDVDNDGLANDIEEGLGSESYLADTDGDGINDKDEVHDVMNPRDSDQDGRLDVLDLDDDNDGVPSVIEGIEDRDNDNIPNYLDTDSDGDGLPDADEVRLSYRDSDKDYVDDVFDADVTRGADKNGDGIIDDVALFDSDKDGVADIWDDDGKTSIVSKKPLTVEQDQTKVKPVQQQTSQTNPSTNVTSDKPLAAAIKNQVSQALQSEGRPINDPQSKAKKATYGGSGFFYCANSGKIITGISQFVITPSHRVALIKDARDGVYQWRTEEKGVYVLQFKLPVGVRVVSGSVRGRIILNEGDDSPYVLGYGKSPTKKGYIDNVANNMKPWYNSFEMKQGAPLFVNNNIPLQGDLCDKS